MVPGRNLISQNNIMEAYQTCSFNNFPLIFFLSIFEHSEMYKR